MKHLFRAVVFIALLCLLLPQVRAQDIDPATYNFGSTSPTAFRSDTARQNYKGFVLGLNWGALPYPARMMDSLNVNVIHEGTWIHNGSGSARDLFDTLATLKKGKKLIHADYLLSQGKPAPYAWAMSMEFDPNRTGAASIYRFEERYKDTIATWGFNVRKIGVTPPLGDTGTVNYSRYLLRADSITNNYAGVPQLVLSDPQPNNQLFTDKWMYDIRGNNHNLFVSDYAGNALHDFDTQLRGGDTTIVYMRGDSTEWWIAVNIRRLINDAQDALVDSTSVLSVRVPLVRRVDSVASDGKRYAIRRDTVYATFDSTAVVGTSTVTHSWLGTTDGTLSPSATTTFIIRKGMLPDDRSNDPDITLSAHFWLPKTDIRDRFKLYDKLYRDSVMAVGSPMRAPDPETQAVLATQALSSIIIGSTTPYLDTLVERVLMDVSYHGKVDVGVDYLRFENRLARQILRGKKDAMMIQRVNEIYSYMDNSTGAQTSKAELFRHYFADETPPMYWRVQEYITDLLFWHIKLHRKW